MIKKTILAFCAIFLCYTLFIALARPKGMAQNQWQRNMVKAQDYVYENGPAGVVIVGSSMAAHLISMRDTAAVCNLSFDGGSPLDGLQLIKQSRRIPELVLIESNVYDRHPRLDIEKEIFLPVLHRLREFVPSLRERYQPVTVFAPGIFKRLMKLQAGIGLLTQKLFPKAEEKQALINPSAGDFQEKLFRQQKEYYDRAPDKKRMEKSLDELSALVSFLAGRGARVAFFEMPVDPRLFKLRRAVTLREELRRRFPPAVYRHVPDPDCALYATSDSIHLTTESAARFLEWIQAEMKPQSARPNP